MCLSTDNTERLSLPQRAVLGLWKTRGGGKGPEEGARRVRKVFVQEVPSGLGLEEYPGAGQVWKGELGMQRNEA